MLLRSYEDETVRRVAAGAIANLAMNGKCLLFHFLRIGRIMLCFFLLLCLDGRSVSYYELVLVSFSFCLLLKV